MSIAQVLFQRFFYRTSMGKHNSISVAMASLFLACKVAETPRKTRDLCNVFHRLRQIRERRTKHDTNTNGDISNTKEPYQMLDVGSAEYWDMKNEIIHTERFLLKELGFIVHVVLPHKYVLNFLKILEANQELTQQSWSYVNDSLRTASCVLFPPESIAAGCIYLAARMLQIPLPEEPKPWWELFDTTEDQIAEICWYIQSLYQQPKPVYIPTKKPYYKNDTFDEEVTSEMIAAYYKEESDRQQAAREKEEEEEQRAEQQRRLEEERKKNSHSSNNNNNNNNNKRQRSPYSSRSRSRERSRDRDRDRNYNRRGNSRERDYDHNRGYSSRDRDSRRDYRDDNRRPYSKSSSRSYRRSP